MKELTEKELDDLTWALKFMRDWERKNKLDKPKLTQIEDNLRKTYPEAFNEGTV